MIGRYLIRDDNGEIIAEVVPMEDRETTANAKLIAAAPEMYALLRDLLVGFYTSPRGEFDARIHAAIAKVEGRS